MPDAVIPDDEQRAIGLPAHADVNGAARAVLHRVRQEVEEDLLQARRDPSARPRALPARAGSRQRASASCWSHPLDDLARQGRQIDRRARERQPPGVQPRDVEQLVDQVREPRDLAVEDLEHRPRSAPGRAPRAGSGAAAARRAAPASCSEVSGVLSSCEATRRNSSRRSIASWASAYSRALSSASAARRPSSSASPRSAGP